MSTGLTSLSTSTSTGISSLSTGVASLSTGLSTTNSNLDSVGTGAAAALGGGASYNPTTGTWTAPSYTINNANGTVSTVNNVGDALTGVYTQGTRYFHANSTLPDSIASGANSVAIGPNAVASGDSAIAVGLGAQATGTNAVAIGTGALATGSVALGASSRAGGGGTAVGDFADAGGTPLSAAPTISRGTAIGYGAIVQQTGGVALGTGSVANRAAGTVTEAYTGVSVNAQAAVSVGSAGNERQITNVAGGTQATDAVNLRQLQAASAASVQYATNPDGSVNYNQVTLGNGQAPNGTVISNVAPGVKGTDAVNVNQLNSGVAAATAYTDSRVNGLQTSINDVAKKSYAGVASAMAMESAPYIPGKLTYAAGLGYYQSQSAVGVSLRRTSDNGRWSVTGGASVSPAGGVAVRAGISGVWD
uniref:YadA family autotransporter adhesin n=1 Tax=Variovorax fucosicus TaxID=3053517 RepID=UPI0033653B9F